MTDDKCPLDEKRLNDLADQVRDGVYEIDRNSVRAALRQAAIEAYKIGHEEGYQCATEFVAGGEECPHRV